MKKQALNVAGLAAGDAGGRFVGFLVTVYLARVLAPSAFGVISIGLAILGQLANVASPGVQVVESRNVAAAISGMGRRVGTVLGMRLVLSLILCALTCAVAMLWPAPATPYIAALLFVASLVPMALILDWYFQGKEEGVVVGGARLLQSVVYGALAYLLVRSSLDMFWVPVAFFFGCTAMAGALLAAYIRTNGVPPIRWDPAGWMAVFRGNAPVGLAAVVGQLIINYPPLAVGWFLSTADAGFWAAAMKLVFLALLIDRVLNLAFLPVITRMIRRKNDDGAVVFAMTLRVVVGGLLPAVFLGVVLAPVAVVWIFGPAYSEAVLVLQILMGYVALTLVNSVFSCALIGGGFEREYGRAVIAGVVVVVAAVTVLTPFAGMMGAAIGVGIGEGATLGLMVRAVLRHLQLPVRIAPGRMVIAALAMSLTPLVLNWLHPGFQSLVGVAVYIVALLLLRELEPGSMSDFRRRLA